jgi:hypothetical protein
MKVQRRVMTLLALVTALLLLFTACGKGGDDDDGVASIDDDSSDQSDDDGGGGGNRNSPADEAEFQDAMLEYAQCMREHGVDMPDPEFDGEGGVMMGAGPGGEDGAPTDSEQQAFEAADEACKPILDEVMPDQDLTPEQQAEMQDQFIEVAQCMREKGHDMPDPVVGDDGSVSIRAEAPEGGGDETGTKGPPSEEFQNDMQDCEEEAGVDRGPPGGSENDDDDDDDSGSET